MLLLFFRLTFGAQLSYSTNSGSSSLASDLRPLISKGMVGCFGKIGAMHAREGIPPLKYAFGGSRDGRAWPVMIDEKTGKVTTRMSLDYEQQSVHRISLLVTDAGGRRAFSTLILNAIDKTTTFLNFSHPNTKCEKFRNVVVFIDISSGGG
ncbi:unnamed protein product [Toxocara canis]|uniref:Cadherin domain-containing protein n=1 Tax=Toxocara canis TaxID=6265 RepID=A0A183U502_TOXCA|nr:unnamed protein product [Toxocara canis]